MKVVIDIDEYDYKIAKELVSEGVFDYNGTTAHIFRSVINGTPLPKGCGDLIDKNLLTNKIELAYRNSLSELALLFIDFMGYVDDARPIIEADKESEE
jgi:hypothetical protein